MTLLLPLGLLALLSVAVLLLIYIIRPNYQQKYISSTYVWKLSLKLKRKRVPISKLRNLLLILCQILFLAACGLAIAQPALVTRAIVSEPEVIAVIDSSASMRAGIDDETRFERAVYGAMDLAAETFAASGYVTVIVAGDAPEVLEQRITSERREILNEKLEELLETDSCSYGTADIDAAMAKCEEIVPDNPNAEIYLYTDTEYSYIPDGVECVDVKEEGEYNAGILDAYAVLEDGWYSIYVEVGYYGGMDDLVTLTANVNGAYSSGGNGVTSDIKLTASNIRCFRDQTTTIIFRSGSEEDDAFEDVDNINIIQIDSSTRFYAFSEILLSIDGQDAFMLDNSFSIFGGQRPVVDVMYVSNQPNTFFPAIIAALTNYYNDIGAWDIVLHEYNSSSDTANMPVSGYDVYIYEHIMPSVMPEDGVVILWDAENEFPSDSGLKAGNYENYIGSGDGGQGLPLQAEQPEHALLKNIVPANITVSLYRSLLSYDGSYDTVLSAGGDPLMLVKNEGASKVIAVMFSVHYSNITIRFKDFSLLFYNIMEYFMPATVSGNAFSVYESVSLRSRGSSLTVTGGGLDEMGTTFNQFPAELELDLPGTYTLTQVTDFGETVVEKIFVKIPSAESNIARVADSFFNPLLQQQEYEYYDDLILYIASAFVALLFIEWLLQYRANV